MLVPLVAEVSDPTAMLIAGLGAAVSAMATFIAAVALAKLNGLTKKDADHDKDLHLQDLRLTRVEVTSQSNEKRIDGLQNTTLTERVFDERTKAQDDRLKAIDSKVTALDRVKASRSDLQAARALEGPPPRRTDGVGDREVPSEPPTDPPPMRPPLRSRGRYGGE